MVAILVVYLRDVFHQWLIVLVKFRDLVLTAQLNEGLRSVAWDKKGAGKKRVWKARDDVSAAGEIEIREFDAHKISAPFPGIVVTEERHHVEIPVGKEVDKITQSIEGEIVKFRDLVSGQGLVVVLEEL